MKVKFSTIFIIAVSVFAYFSGCFAKEGFQARQEARIVFIGDIFLGNWAVEYIDKFGVDYPFRGCEELLRDADLAVGNLEGSITAGGEPFSKEYLLKSPPGCEAGLKEANIRAVSLANNHILDYGLTGLRTTFERLDSSDISYFGAGMNRTEALKAAKFTVKGQTFAFIGFSATFPREFWATDSTAGTAFPWREDLEAVIPRCDAENDAVIIAFHWGAELRETPKDYQVDLAHLCIDLGADLIIGHHPHIPQGVEVYNGVPVFYSLGNFAFASYSESARVGIAAVADFSGGRVVKAEVFPLNVYNAEIIFQPRPLQDGPADEYLKHLNAVSKELNGGKIVINKMGTLIL